MSIEAENRETKARPLARYLWRLGLTVDDVRRLPYASRDRKVPTMKAFARAAYREAGVELREPSSPASETWDLVAAKLSVMAGWEAAGRPVPERDLRHLADRWWRPATETPEPLAVGCQHPTELGGELPTSKFGASGLDVPGPHLPDLGPTGRSLGDPGFRLVLVTGSRFWDATQPVRDALREQGEIAASRGQAPMLLHGACPWRPVDGRLCSADAIADWVATQELGWPVEAHPADWDRHGKAAGPRRNREMVQRRPAVCLAFPDADRPSQGTRGCMQLARGAGIPVILGYSPKGWAHLVDAGPVPGKTCHWCGLPALTTAPGDRGRWRCSEHPPLPGTWLGRLDTLDWAWRARAHELCAISGT